MLYSLSMTSTQNTHQRIVGSKRLSDTVIVNLVRSALGQVAEYDVYRIENGVETYLGGGSKREGLKIFNRTVA